MAEDTYPFPFLGAGKAQYFEYCEITVRFCEPPSRAIRKKISQWAPPVFELTDGDFTNRILVARSPQYVNKAIQNVYGEKKDKIPKGEDVNYRSTEKALHAFEGAVEGWLSEVHKISPIEVVFRGEDGEVGGTKLSAWHNRSVERINDLVKHWIAGSAEDLEAEELEHFGSLIEGVLCYAVNLPISDLERLKATVLPARYVQTLAEERDLKKLELLFGKSSYFTDQYFEKLCDGFIYYLASKEHDDVVTIKVVHMLIRDSRFLHLIVYHNAQNNHLILVAALKLKDVELVRRIQKLMATVPDAHLTRLVQPIYWETLNSIHRKKEWQLAISLYDFLIDLIKDRDFVYHDLSFYCNTLWVLQKDNTGLPINKIVNAKFLSVCLPHGHLNPAVFYNAACVYNEMDDIDLAFDCIKRAVDAGLKGAEYQSMLNDIASSDLFKKLRSRSDISKYLEALPR